MNYLKKIISLSLLIVILAAGLGYSQEQQWVSLTDYHVVSVKDNQYHLTLKFEITDQFHIQAFVVNDEYLIPTTISFKNGECMEVEDISLPTAEESRITGYDKPLLIHMGNMSIDVIITSSCNNDIPENLLTGELYYQACQGTKCFYPRALSFNISLDDKVLATDHFKH